jgi:hypothetical protein
MVYLTERDQRQIWWRFSYDCKEICDVDDASVSACLAQDLSPSANPQGALTVDAPQGKQKIPGNNFGTTEVAKSPITITEWQELQKSALFSEQDVFYLRLSEEALAGPGRRPAQNLARYCFRPPASAGL